MADVLHRVTLEYRQSVHTPDYNPADWLIDPDLSQVVGAPRKYWKVVGNSVVLMDQQERDAVDAREAAETWRPVVLQYVFTANKASNKWLDWGKKSSDDYPAVVGQPATLSLVAFGSGTTFTGSVDIARNGSVVLTLPVNASNSLIVNGFQTSVDFATGDTLAVYLDTSGTQVEGPVVVVSLRPTAFEYITG